MMKQWIVRVVGRAVFKGFFGKEREEFGYGQVFTITAETKEEAIEKAKKEYDDLQISTGSAFRFHHASSAKSWDTWTVKQAINMLNGKEFAEYARQQGLTSLFE